MKQRQLQSEMPLLGFCLVTAAPFYNIFVPLIQLTVPNFCLPSKELEWKLTKVTIITGMSDVRPIEPFIDRTQSSPAPHTNLND